MRRKDGSCRRAPCSVHLLWSRFSPAWKLKEKQCSSDLIFLYLGLWFSKTSLDMVYLHDVVNFQMLTFGMQDV